MIHRLTFLGLCFSATLCSAQDQWLTLYGGGTAGKVHLPSFEAFRGTFNDVNATFTTSELSGFGLSKGWQGGAILMLNPHIGVSFSYWSQTASAKAEFTDGSSRHFKHRLYTPLMGGIYILAGPIEIHPRLGFCQANLHSWTEYPDGTESYGKDRLLNGVYRTFGLFGGLDLGVRIKLGEVLSLAIGGSWYAVSGSEYTNPDWSRSLDVGTLYPQEIPTDWATWLDDAAAFDLTGYDVNDYVKLKGSWYAAYLNLMIDLK